MNLPSGDLEPFSKGNVESLSTRFFEQYQMQRIKVNAESIGVTKWQEMLTATQQDQKERDIVISKTFGENVLTSNIFVDEEHEVDAEGRKVKSVPHRSYPHKLLSPLTRKEGVVVVHTHPIPSDDSKIQTTLPSNKDIHAFNDSNYSASVVLDTGGAHLLIAIRSHSQPIPYDLTSQAVRIVKERNGRRKESINELAKVLESHGIGYYYAPFPLPQQQYEYVEFQKAKAINFYPEQE